MSNNSVIEKANNAAVMYPLNIYPTMLSVFVGGYCAYEFSWMIVSVASFLFVFGVTSFVTNVFFRKTYFLHVALEQHNEAMRTTRKEYILNLRKSLSVLGCQDGSDQLERLIGKVRLFEELAAKRFGAEAMASESFIALSSGIETSCYSRYERMVEQLKIANDINETYCNDRISELEQSNGNDGEIKDLRSHLMRKGSAQQRVQSFIANNEKAIASLSDTMHNFDKADDDREVAWALEELKGLSTTLGMIKDEGAIEL